MRSTRRSLPRRSGSTSDTRSKGRRRPSRSTRMDSSRSTSGAAFTSSAAPFRATPGISSSSRNRAFSAPRPRPSSKRSVRGRSSSTRRDARLSCSISTRSSSTSRGATSWRSRTRSPTASSRSMTAPTSARSTQSRSSARARWPSPPTSSPSRCALRASIRCRSHRPPSWPGLAM